MAVLQISPSDATRASPGPRVATAERHLLVLLALAILLVAAIANGFSLGHYPPFYVDDAFFAFPALKAAAGGAFTYQVGSTAPYAQQIWAYHGPLFPHILRFLFHTFGFSASLSRLPDFLGAWLAAFAMVIYLARRGNGVAALALAILWCGDRAPQEVMYGRMDGLALLSLTVTFLAAVQIFRKHPLPWAYLAGLSCGIACLLNPFCAVFGVTLLLLLVLLRRARPAAMLLFGLLSNLPLLLFLWNFHIREAMAQFLWHAHRLETHTTAVKSFVIMVEALGWSRYWFLALVLVALCWIAGTALVWWRTGPRSLQPETLLIAAFTLAALPAIFRASTHPYYIVYFSLWPLLGISLLVQNYRKQWLPIAAALGIAWSVSAAWNLLRIREDILFHRGLNNRALVALIDSQVPRNAEIVATPELYAVPLEAGHPNFDLTTWFNERLDVCPACYLLMTRKQFLRGDHVAPLNLARRVVLFNGPAFPGTGPLQYPIVLLSPERDQLAHP